MRFAAGFFDGLDNNRGIWDVFPTEDPDFNNIKTLIMND